jgi:pimeloyl-ACP methyl ester carboxylesterase
VPYVEAGAVTLYFEAAGGGGNPVVPLHELGGSSESRRAVTPLLATDRRVIAVDLRCAGRSEKPLGGFGLADVAGDLDGVLRELKIDRIDVIGAALGSLVGASLAIRHPDRARRLMMCAVAADMARDFAGG